MSLFDTCRIQVKHYNHIFDDTVKIYRKAVDFLIDICMKEWPDISKQEGNLLKQRFIERLCHACKNNPEPKYMFDKKFYKFPSYLLRAAINEAIGRTSSYMSNLSNWESLDVKTRGLKPGYPKAGFSHPCLYKDNMYEQTGSYTANIKVFVHNTWDWITVSLKKSDVDYINKRCSLRKKCVPTLMKRGKEWYLDFPFEERTKLPETDIFEQTIIAVDLGINSSATISVMRSDGAVLDRKFLRLSIEYDSLNHSVNRIKKAQQNGNYKTPRLWAKAKGINDDISVKTASFIMDTAVLYNADVIVFEHLDVRGKKHGSKKQRLHM